MATHRELRPLSTMPPPRNSGFAVREPESEGLDIDRGELEEFYRSIFERSSEGVFVCGFDGRFRKANRATLEMLGISEGDIPSVSFLSLISKEQYPLLMDSLNEIAEHGFLGGIARFNLRTPDGRQMVVAAKASLLMDHGDPSALLCIFRDVTDFFKLQEELRRSAALATAGEVAGKAGHDIRNLLAPAKMLVDYMLGMKPEDMTPERMESLIRIAATVNVAMEEVNILIGKLMVLSAPGLRNAVDADVNPMLRILAERLSLPSSPAKYVVRMDLSEGPLIVRGDKVELDRALTNIVTNAVDAMPHGGVLTISSGKVREEGREWARITISDTGHGMSEEVISRIFDPHFTTKGARGNGLGLAITSKTISDHNGIIRVTSEEGLGTTFDLLLPMP